MDGGDLIYLVLGAIFIIGSLYKQVKKAAGTTKNMQPEAEPVPRQTTVDDDWFREIIEQDEETTLPPPPPLPINETANYTTNYRTITGQQTTSKSVFSEKSFFDEMSNPAQEPVGIDIDLSDQDEARKAFIYSEIFQRKY